MERRFFLGLLAAWAMPRPVRGQSAARALRVGLVSLPLAEGSPLRPWWEPFFSRMSELGYVEGETVHYDTTRAGGRADLLDGSVAELMERHHPDVLVSTGVRETRAAGKATPSRPVVMFLVGDAVAAGLAASPTRPGGNITGLNTADPAIEVKRIELLKEFIPDASRLAVLGFVGLHTNEVRIQTAREAGRALGTEVLFFESEADPERLKRTFADMRAARVAGVSVLEVAEFYSLRRTIADAALEQRLPSVFGQRDYVTAGGLAGYTPRLSVLQARAADYVVRIAKGEDPGNLPIEHPTQFEFLINLRTAETLGLTVPPALLARADDIVE